MTYRGLITQATYRVTFGPDGRRRPVVHAHGRLDDGRSFLVREDRQRPHFYIRARDTERARPMIGACAVSGSGQRSFDGGPVELLEFDLPGDVPAVRDRLHAAAIDTFEADVRFAVRYLIDRGIKGGCAITGEPQPGENVDWVFDNPTLQPAPDVAIEPRVLSFDIETTASSERLLAISMYGLGLDEVLIVDSGDRPMPERSVRCADEHAALSAFCERVRIFDGGERGLSCVRSHIPK